MFTGESKIIAKRKIAERAWEIELEKPADFSYAAGQYVWVVLKEEKFPDPRGQRRAFSLLSLPQDASLKILLRESESGYKKGLLSLSVGDVVILVGPFGSFAFPADATIPVVCVIGGVGIAPFLPLLQSAFAQQQERAIRLIYATHSEQEAPYLSMLQDFQKNHAQFSLISAVGKVTQEVLASALHSFPSAKWLIVGPESFVAAVCDVLFLLGVKEEQMVFEEFYWTHNHSDEIAQEVSRQTQSNFFALAMKQTASHVIITDVNGTILFANQAAEQITGYSFSEMQQQTPRLWGGLQTHEFYEKLWQTIKVDKTPFAGEITNRRKNGEQYTAIVHISPITDTKGALIGFIATEEDITRAKEVDRMKTEFISVASHQLRTPLGIMKWYLEVIENDDYLKKAPDTIRGYFSEMTKSNQRVLDLVRELLSVSRIEQGRVKNIPKPIDLLQLVTEIVKQMQVVATKKGITLVLNAQEGSIPVITIDALRLHDALENLIANALEYTESTGKVTVTVGKKDAMVIISIEDTGIGISPNDQKKIFTKFFRAERAVSFNPEGTGLGLYVVKSYVEDWGGEILVTSTEGKGSVFSISLPTGQNSKA